MSSLEASPQFYQPEDWQLKNTEFSYQSSKYQIDILATQLDHLSLAQEVNTSGPSQVIRHFLAEPGVCHTNVHHAIGGPLVDFWKLLFFYIVRSQPIHVYHLHVLTAVI